MAREIPLTRGYAALVDDDDYAVVSQHRWFADVQSGGLVYARARLKGKMVRLHRFLLGPPSGVQVDHRNGDGLDCQRANLRTASHAQNHHNIAPRAASSTYKGVSRTPGQRWLVQIRAFGKTYSVGTFAEEDIAARAYDAAARQLHGEFAWLNFPLRDADGIEADRALLADAAFCRPEGWKASRSTTFKPGQAPSAKLTAADVREIRRRLAIDLQSSIAADFGISPKTVSCIATRRTWAHVP